MMLSRLSRNSFWLTLARLGTQLGLALFTVLLARQLGAQAFGEYAFMSAIVLLGNAATTFGTDMYLIREIAASGDESLLSPALVLQVLLSAAFIGAVLLASGFLRFLSSEGIVAMRIYALSLIPLAFFTVHTIALRGRQQMFAYSILNLALVALQAVAIVALIRLHGGLVLLALLLLLIQCLAALLAGRLSRLRFYPRRLGITDLHPVGQLLKASASIAALAIIGIAYQRLSLLVLPLLANAALAGWFSAASRVVEAAKLAHIAAFTALFPMMAQARSASASDFARTFRLPWWLLLGAATVASLAISAFAAPIVSALYGPAYAGSIQLLRILGWALIPYSVNGFLTLAFLARGRTDGILRALAAATLTLAALTVWLLPVLGAPGAAVAALSAEVVQTIVLVLHLGRLDRLVPPAFDPSRRLSTQE